jgi:hypothetical protein
MVVTATIGTFLLESFKSPSTQLANKRMEFFQSEIFWYDRHETFSVNNLPGSPMRLKNRWQAKEGENAHGC